MTRQTLTLTEELYHYLLANSLREDPVLQALRQATLPLPGSQMQISPEQGQFMALLVKLMGAKRALDIGTFTGYSALVIAKALPEDGQVFSFDIDEQATTIAKNYWEQANVSAKIKLHLGKASSSLNQLIAEGQACTFDFSFIDADKKGNDDYYEKSLVLLRKGGLIAIDNVLWSGKVANPKEQDPNTDAIRQFNQKIYHDPRVEISLLPLGDGLTLALKK